MSLSDRKAACIVAMHAAAGPHFGLPGQWVDLSQKKPELAAAMRGLFKGMPTPQILGTRLHEYIGLKAGELTLYGRHSPRAKGWRYAVMTTGELEAHDRRIEEKAAAKEAKLQAYLDEYRVKDRIRKERRDQERRARGYIVPAGPTLNITRVPAPDALSELAPAPTSGPIAATLPQPVKPTHGDDFLTRTVYDGDGVPRQEYVRDRSGNPVPSHSRPVAAPAPQPKPAEPVRPDPNREPAATPDLTPPEGEWFNGCGRPRSPLERWRLGRAAGQGVTVSAGLHYQSDLPRPGGYREEYGFDDPGGVISHAINGNRRKWSTFGDWEP